MIFEDKRVWLMLGLLAAPASLLGQGEWSGFVSAETRVWESSPLYAGQKEGVSAALILEPEYYNERQDGDLAFEFTPYARIDTHDEERDIFDIRELSFLKVMGDWEVRAGISKVFWGVVESQHLVDTINQTDAVASPDLEDKLGQPMLQVVNVSPVGDFSFFVLPYFRERTFPGVEGRLRTPLVVDTDNPLFESSDEEEHVDFAFRWFNIIGDFDIGLHYFRGTNRDPLFVESVKDGAPGLRPYYEQMDQIGLDLQYTKEGWLWKLEALGRETESDRYSAVAGGFEYTLFGFAGSDKDLGLLAEGHLDSRGKAAPTPFNRDVFVGARLTWNDEADTALIAGTFMDWETQALFGRLEFEKRVGNDMKLEIELQRLANADAADAFYQLRDDNYLQVTLSKFW
ncbi:MAG: hypothetical protein AAGB46_06755 [Verrucomicrobiota bacterium]